MSALLLLIVVHAAFIFLPLEPVAGLLLRFFQGTAFALVQVSLGSTLLNDLCSSELRDKADVHFVQSGRVGLFAGILLAKCSFRFPINMDVLLWVPVALSAVSWVLISPLKVPFRAPLSLPLCSTDRFWFRGRTFLGLSLLLFSAASGLLLWQLFSLAERTASLFPILLFALPFLLLDVLRARRWLAGGFLLLLACILLLWQSVGNLWVLISVSGLACMGVSLLSMALFSLYLSGTAHCRRGTAQHTYLLLFECGLALGLCCGCMLSLGNAIFAGVVFVFASLACGLLHLARRAV